MTTSLPLVSVIVVCYNHERFVREAIQSVLDQTYPNIELIVVDDGSTDSSVSIIQSMGVTLIDLKTNRGYCTAFNAGWRASKGDFIIDLAADDMLATYRVMVGIDEFMKRDESFGVQYGDAHYIDEAGTIIDYHERKFKPRPDGYVYSELIRRYFICAASMMSRRSVLTTLNGYDESLTYEDFDFWVRSARHFKYFHIPGVYIDKRIVKGSLSEKQFMRGSPQQISTYKVCEKILGMNRTLGEHMALRERVKYEMRKAVMRMELGLARKYFELLRSIP